MTNTLCLKSSGDSPITIELKNENDLYELIEIINDVQSQAAKIAAALLSLSHNKVGYIDGDDITFEHGNICVAYHEQFRGVWTKRSEHIPLIHFFEENFFTAIEEQLQAQEELKRQKKEEHKRKIAEQKIFNKNEKERKERELFLRLKEKYGENN